MEIDGRVAVITQGLSDVTLAFAKRLSDIGAAVVIADKNEKLLVAKAAEIGATAITADISQIGDVKNLVDKTNRKFGRIDLFISNQSEVMSQMYAAKYVLPQMVNRKNGYLLNMVPSRGLLQEHRCDFYTTLKHPSLGFAERMATRYHDKGIRVSVFCYEHSTARLENLADLVISGIQHERFMIFSQTEKDDPVQSELRRYEIYGAMRA